MSDLNAKPEEELSSATAQVAADAAGAEDEAALADWASALAEQNENSSEISASTAGVFQPLSKVAPTTTRNDIDMILDIPVQMTVELGRTKLAIRNLLQLAQGSVVELDGMAGEPMDVLVNGCLIAQGEVVVVNDKFGIRLTDIITPSERIRKLNR
ncbi:flagellar motor switch protein FliN [bacterium M00.F.Ca.ET.228.01.1.1]|uniref:flagellar motor switch protein FliN n=1 Tax=Paraburkholderia phenoliruptrix TaxID=252970 RepID=UPI001091C8B5|nr:flagellar motor switch protein FliN [Paraburkholderia phenoliruptrix]TGP45106.1 flagellar motor switch protein FliN [bacterium M00.F.Ca.ET.228.01.1.1]TGS02989.1 flagellar motor switch protein FliN [bacterium M00.F.Ca.ET.191.01.1.1]TGU06371.1 flagellar motor switch protein FliN [bacterium M00.F.Ca.ET.155.01.1.1]MBW0448836.1 flagellar motor switch protein FliN [Paraburkholderia phenoliruptrix]MBW9097813.1 flagellar motor switch protein FliN [Paraburkholderia phenoliruptrix]